MVGDISSKKQRKGPCQVTSLLEALIKKQNQLGFNDQEFAKYLGLHTHVWRNLRGCRNYFSTPTLSAIARTFHDLDETVMTYLRESHAC